MCWTSGLRLTHWSAVAPLCRADRTRALCLSGPAAPHTPSCSPDGSTQSHCKHGGMVRKGRGSPIFTVFTLLLPLFLFCSFLLTGKIHSRIHLHCNSNQFGMFDVDSSSSYCFSCICIHYKVSIYTFIPLLR